MTAVDPVDTTYTDGKLYFSSMTLALGTDYTYYFSAYDVWNTSATETPTTSIDAPNVSVSIIITTVTQPGEIKIIGGSESKGTVNPDKGEKASISFKGNSIGKFECKIFTLIGEPVWEDTKENVSEGMFEWFPENIASGVYVVSIKGPGVKVYKKIVIIR